MNIQEASNILSLILILYSSAIFYYNFGNIEKNIEKPYNLDSRMKYYEEQTKLISKIEPHNPFVVRIDGWNFRSLTSNFKKPFDDVFAKLMIKTANDLLLKFNPSSVFVQSDEITLIFPPLCDNNDSRHVYTHIFGGNVNKITTIIASYASTKLTSYIRDYYNQSHDVSFDGRVIVYPEEYEILNNLIWRSSYHGYHNYISMNAYYYLNQKDVEKMSAEERIYALKEKGILLENSPINHFYGTLIKKIKNNDNKITSKAFSFEFKFSKDLYQKIMQKYLLDDTITDVFEVIDM